MVDFKIHINKDDIIKAIDEKMDEVVDEIFAKSQSNIVDKNIIDEGTLLKSGNINRQLLHKQIVYPVPHADSIEFGRLPGSMPPVSPLVGWVKRVLNERDDSKAKSIAWAIAQDIKIKGTMPRPFLSPAIEAVRNKK